MGCAGSKTQTASDESYLVIDEKLNVNDFAISPNQAFKLLLKEDGNLVVLKGEELWWESNTAGKGATYAMVKKDGDFALFKGEGEEVWSLGSANCGGTQLWVEDDGNVILYDGDTPKCSIYEEWLKAGEELEKGDWLWSNNGKFTLTLEENGNLVLADADKKTLWQSNTAGATRLVMQTDGNLVLYNGEEALWASNTNGTAATEMWVEDDGKIVLWDASDNKVWEAEIVAPAPAAAAVAAAPAEEVVEPWLDVDEKLAAGDWVWSPNKEFKLLLREDGNFVVLHKDSEVWWESKTSGSGATHAVLRSNQDFVLLKGDEEVWSLGSANCGGNKLWVEDSGFVGLYDGDNCKVAFYEEWLKAGEDLEKGDWLWSNNGEYTLTLEEGGTLVIKSYTGEVIWQVEAPGADSLDMQTDGNLVLYKGEEALWATNTEGSAAKEAWLEDNGKLVLWDENDVQVWSS